jgi:hypothetical protein
VKRKNLPKGKHPHGTIFKFSEKGCIAEKLMVKWL